MTSKLESNIDTRWIRWKKIMQLAWPLIVANSFWNLQLTIDRILLGHYSTESLGASMAVMSVFWVPMALLQQTASYVSTFIAQLFGGKEWSEIGHYVWQALIISLYGGILFICLNFFSSYFFNLTGHSEKMQELEVLYFNSLSYSALPTAIVATVSGFFAGLGITQTVIWINLTGLILNALLGYLMIFGHFGLPALGIAGAGYATAIATYIAALVGLYLLFTYKQAPEFNLFFRWKNWVTLKQTILKKFIKYGVPSGFQWALEGLAFSVFLIILGQSKQGDAALSSSSILISVMMIAVLPTMGIAQAIMTFMGQFIGQGNPNQAARYTWDGVEISFLYIASIAITLILFPNFYLSWFENKENLELWSQILFWSPRLFKIFALFVIFDSIYLNVSFALKGAGDTKFVSMIALILPWPMFVLPAFLLRHHENALVFSWWFVPLYSITITSLLAYRFQKGGWKNIGKLYS